MKTKSKWFWWCFVPVINWAAWIHACARTGNRSYALYAAAYGIPFMATMVFDPNKKGITSDIVSGIIAVAWIAGMIHVMLQKDSVDRQIEDRDQRNAGAQQTVPLRPSHLVAQPSPGNQLENVLSNFGASVTNLPPPPPIVQQPRESQLSSEPVTTSRMDLNSANETQMAGLPGVGIILGKKAVMERQRRGGFGSIEEFCEALAMKPHIAERVRPLVEIGPRGNLQGTSTSGRVIDY